MNLADQIKVNTRYTRSINVERDRGSRAILEAYLPSAGGVELLTGIADTLGAMDQPRAWSLIGPYGSGKSSFALFLHELLGGGSIQTTARELLAAENPSVAQRFHGQTPWCRVVLSGSEEAFPTRLLAALDEAATEYWKGRMGRKPAVLERIRDARAQGLIGDSEVLGLVEELRVAVEKAGGGGLLLLIDELGKLLEYEARQGDAGIFLLQGLAEQASRGGQANLLVVVLLHQGFDLYARSLGEKQRNDWAKVQGRFETVSFIEPAAQVLRVVATAFANTLTTPQRHLVRRAAEGFADGLAAANALPPGIERRTAAGIFAKCYPIHPVALLLLPDLCQRFAQNERTLFSYLGSREPQAFRDALASLANDGSWLQPASVYDYFVRNQPAVLSDPLTHRRWAEVVTAVERADSIDSAPGLECTPTALAKTVGLLNLVARADGLKASREILRLLFPSDGEFNSAISSLLKSSVVQYRRFSDEYRVWQGTDFDIDERVAAELQKLGHFNLAETLAERGDVAPVVARRHSAASGTLRYFEVTFVEPGASTGGDSDGGAPRIVFALAERREHESAFRTMLAQGNAFDLWVLHEDGAAIRDLVADALALEALQRGAQELTSDPVAAREIRERLNVARAAESDAVARLLREPALSEWLRAGQRLDIKDRRQLQHELSQIMDDVYRESPIVRNELVNRNRLSSQAAAARNKLFRQMLDCEGSEELGIEKYPPEQAIYRSILAAGGLHRQTPDGWAFVPPSTEDPLTLRPVWTGLDRLMEVSEDAPITFEHLADALAEPPIGLRRGVFPILFLHYYILHRYEIALYDEGTYAPTLTYEHLERLIRRPDLFSFQRFRIQGVRADLFDEYVEALFDQQPASTDPLPLARALLQFVEEFDDYTRRTRRLSPVTLRVRDALYFSKSPQALLFEALPVACECNLDGDLSGFAERLKTALRELKHAQGRLVDDMRAALCRAFGLEEALPLSELRELARSHCHGLARYTIDTEGILTFVRRIGDREPDDERWLEAILLFLGRKPVTKWTDQDRDTAEYRLAELSYRLRDLEKLRLHFDAPTQGYEGHEPVFIKTIGESGPHDAVVVLTPEKIKATDGTLQDIRELLAGVDSRELQLALVARLSRRFLSEYHAAQLSESEEERERQHERRNSHRR